jgi:uracil-DNA glycosylase family 4
MEKWPRNLDNCKYCGEESKAFLREFNKPCMKSEAHHEWKPDTVNVLFIAESPPGHERRYFYNMNTRNITREKLLDLLEMKGLGKFRGEGYFLTDTIKCRLRKQGRGRSFPSYIADNCATRFLYSEIQLLKPKTIVLLGKTAKQRLQRFPEFEKLRTYRKVEDYCGEKIHTEHQTVIMYAFPRQRNPRVIQKILAKPLADLLNDC